MSEAAEFDDTCFQTTDGDIAVINLESARRRSWSRFYQDPMREGIAETVVEHEQLSAQFAGDLTALDRLEFLAKRIVTNGRGVSTHSADLSAGRVDEASLRRGETPSRTS